jgi:hypothetical protein
MSADGRKAAAAAWRRSCCIVCCLERWLGGGLIALGVVVLQMRWTDHHGVRLILLFTRKQKAPRQKPGSKVCGILWPFVTNRQSHALRIWVVQGILKNKKNHLLFSENTGVPENKENFVCCSGRWRRRRIVGSVMVVLASFRRVIGMVQEEET